MKTQTNIKAGGRQLNHNETLVRDHATAKAVPASPRGLKVKTNLKAGRKAGGGSTRG